MNQYSVKIVDNINSDVFKQLEELIEKFAIDVYITQKFNLSNKSNKVKQDYIRKYNQLLSNEELIFLDKDIKERIEFAKESIEKEFDNKITRYYVLLNNDQVIAFQTAQIRNENDRLEGWRNFAYIDSKYVGKIGLVSDTYNETKEGFFSDIIYENITKWFKENNVVLEKTATGKNMYKNILVYIVYKGFIPESTDDKRVYLIKDYSVNKSKKELKEIYDEYINSNKV